MPTQTVINTVESIYASCHASGAYSNSPLHNDPPTYPY